MAKRFTDTEKWKDPWWNSLSLKMQVAWMYLLDNCDHAGFWPVDLGLMSYQIKEPITRYDLETWFDGKLNWVNDSLVHVTPFIKFQYKNELNPANKTHMSILKALSSNRIKWEPKGLAGGAKDKEQDQDQVLDRDKDQDPAAIFKLIKTSLGDDSPY